jgi:hypothetical protein
MARSYQNYKQNLNEQEQKLLEIGQLVQPYETDFLFSEKGNMVYTDFRDDQRNDIRVMFHRFKEESDSFEMEFTVNGYSGEAFKTDSKHFFKIISTVVQAINEFIEKYNPTQLFIEGEDKPGKQGQKDRIWIQYAKVNIKADDYTLGTYPKGFGIQNNTKIKPK